MNIEKVGPNKKSRALLIVVLVIFVVLLGAVATLTVLGNAANAEVLTYELAEPLNDVTSAKINLQAGDGNLTVDTLTGGEKLLAGGTLQYLENQNPPDFNLVTFNGQAEYELIANGKGQTWLKLPWAACNGATEWLIHLNTSVAYEITAHSDGGNIYLDLSGATITGVNADTGGGNMVVVLPDNAKNISVTAVTGAGNVDVYIPSGVSVKINADSGLGEVIVDSQFDQIDEKTYQSPDYESAADKIEITVESGAGNVSVIIK